MLGGFEDEDPAFAVDREAAASEESAWDLSGSYELSGSVNFRNHESDTGTDYTGLQRLRQRLNLQLDVDLSESWQTRVEGWGFADSAYLLNGSDEYTRAVRSNYELDADLGEVWVQGRLLDWLDMKAGRQVVIWGRSESLRVLDVLNPLDNREPGRVDIEDLRLPVSMLRLDAYRGDWSLSTIAIPEIRFDETPVRGSDFFTSPPPGVPVPRESTPDDYVDPEFAARLQGIFSGWDVSLHGAYFWNDRPRLKQGAQPAPFLVHDRLWLAGIAGNLTTGGFLFKSELAYVDGVSFFERENEARMDGLFGFEYYGWIDTTLSVEIAVRHMLDWDGTPRLPDGTGEARRTQEEVAIRLSRTFLREKLDLLLVAVLLEGDAKDGAILRADLDYELSEGLNAGIGVIFYDSGERPPLDTWEKNDRVIFDIKWSF